MPNLPGGISWEEYEAIVDRIMRSRYVPGKGSGLQPPGISTFGWNAQRPLRGGMGRMPLRALPAGPTPAGALPPYRPWTGRVWPMPPPEPAATGLPPLPPWSGSAAPRAGFSSAEFPLPPWANTPIRAAPYTGVTERPLPPWAKTPSKPQIPPQVSEGFTAAEQAAWAKRGLPRTLIKGAGKYALKSLPSIGAGIGMVGAGEFSRSRWEKEFGDELWGHVGAEAIGGASQGAALGFGAGQVVPVVGPAVGAAVGLIGGAMIGGVKGAIEFENPEDMRARVAFDAATEFENVLRELETDFRGEVGADDTARIYRAGLDLQKELENAPEATSPEQVMGYASQLQKLIFGRMKNGEYGEQVDYDQLQTDRQAAVGQAFGQAFGAAYDVGQQKMMAPILQGRAQAGGMADWGRSLVGTEDMDRLRATDPALADRLQQDTDRYWNAVQQQFRMYPEMAAAEAAAEKQASIQAQIEQAQIQKMLREAYPELFDEGGGGSAWDTNAIVDEELERGAR